MGGDQRVPKREQHRTSMTDFKPISTSSPYGYPNHLTVPQFLLDESHPLRPGRRNHPWLVDEATGTSYNLEQIRQRVWSLASGLRAKFGIRIGDVVCLYSPNHIDYAVVIWALHRLGAIVSCANPSYTIDELAYQLKAVSAGLIFSAVSCLSVAKVAASNCGLSPSSLVVFSPVLVQKTADPLHGNNPPPFQIPTVESLIAEGSLAPRDWEEERGPLVGERVAFLSFSSGTTGLPKAVTIVHSNVIANILQMASHLKINDSDVQWDERLLRPGEVALGVLPFSHIYGLVVTLHFSLFAGLSLVVFPKFNFVELMEGIVRHRITTLWAVPPLVVMLCNHPDVSKYDLSHVRLCTSGAAPLSREVTEKLKQRFPKMCFGQGFGMTELCGIVSMIAPDQQKTGGTSGSAGQLLTDSVARIVKDDGTLGDYDEPGELWVKGPQVAIGYPNDEQATRETFTEGGWLRTGDVAYITREREIFVVDRLKEILKVNGYQVAPAELEGHLVVHPFVADVGVVGISDDRRGELPLAFIVLEAQIKQKVELDPAEGEAVKRVLEKHVADHKARYKWLDGGVEFIDAIPKNPSGKVLRRILRQRAEALENSRQALQVHDTAVVGVGKGLPHLVSKL